MFKWIKKLFPRNVTIVNQTLEKSPGVFSTEFLPPPKRSGLLDFVNGRTFSKTVDQFKSENLGVAMDSSGSSIKSQFRMSQQTIPDAQLGWYATQGFIGYQTCAMIAQHWLVNKACSVPARDAIRNGYEITVNDGIEVAPEVLDAIRKADLQYRLKHNLVNFVYYGRMFGIRIAMFKVDSIDPKYYENPFNIDGVTPGSYKGITQIDPYWITPELDSDASANPESIHFYEPTWWRVNGKRIHRTHLIIMRASEVADVLKPSYLYGGVSIPQKIYERVYASERTANEAPELALTKRTTIIHVDVAKALANQSVFEEKMASWVYYRNNYAVKILGTDETAEQFDTSLADLDALIMTQYQLVAAIANVPAVKLMGTSPKGFNTTGEFEEANYHEELESIQAHDLSPLIERHHLLIIQSEIAPQFSIAPFSTTIVWNKLDSMTTEEQATLNKTKAETGAALVASGAIDPEDERQRLINDPNSGYNGMTEKRVESDPEENDPSTQEIEGENNDPYEF